MFKVSFDFIGTEEELRNAFHKTNDEFGTQMSSKKSPVADFDVALYNMDKDKALKSAAIICGVDDIDEVGYVLDEVADDEFEKLCYGD